MEIIKYNNGQLGMGDTENRGDEESETGNNLPFINLGTNFFVLQISIGEEHICAILNNSKLKCWGQGKKGILGYGDTKKRGHKPGEMGNNLPFLSLGSDRFVLSVSCGYEHTCALLDNKMIKCWGSNTFNPAGLPLPSNYIIETGNKLPFADLGSNLFVNEIYTGYYTSCALIAIVDKIKCWGIVEGVLSN